MITPNEFVNEFSNHPGTGLSVKFAQVDPAYHTGNPKLIFDGETSLTQKAYPRLVSYTPRGGERVMVINGVIIGEIAQ